MTSDKPAPALSDMNPACIEYTRVRAAHVAAIQAGLHDHVGRLHWSREQIEHYREQRLRSLLAYARERSPFHSQRLDGLDVTSMTVADLASLPIMTKTEAQHQWDAIVTTPGLTRSRAEQILADQQWFSYTEDDQQIFSSGGSSGVRGVYVWDWQFLVTAAGLAWRMQAHDERKRSGSETRLAVVTAGVPPHASTPLFDVPTVEGMQTAVIEAAAPFEDVVSTLARTKPTHLVGYATVIGRIARACLSGELHIAPIRVSTNSEPLVAEDRAAISQAWAPRIHNLWGSTEIGVQAVGCGYGEGLHVCEDEVILERVDENGAPVEPHAPAARTLATGLANRSFPFIRYDLGDEVTTLAGPCPCGSAFARIADITGRRDDDFTYGTMTVPVSALRHVLGTDPDVTEYQVFQTADGLDVLVVGQADVDRLQAALTDVMGRRGLAGPRIDLRSVEALERHSTSGKLRRFIPLR